MLEQLKQVDNIYDLMALCASYVVNEYNKSENVYEFATFEDNKFKDVYNAVVCYTVDCQDEGRRDAFNELKKFVLSFLEDNLTVERVYAIIYYIDELVEIELDDGLIEGNHIIKYSALNEQYQDCVRIIPKRLSTFLSRGDTWYRSTTDSQYSMFRDRREFACSCLDRETNNYSIWDRGLIGKYPFTIYRFDEKSSVARHFCDRDKFNFGVVPFTDKALEQILDIQYRERAFFISKMYDEIEEEFRERYNDICERSSKNDVDFLVFPEMLLTEDIIFSGEEQEEGASQIIVNGSISRDQVNRTVVTDGNKNEIFTYCKKEPFTMKSKGIKYKEWLNPTKNKEYSIIEIEEIGRVGIAICKDLLSEDVRLFHKHIGTDILIVPAYTSSSDLLSAAQNMSTDYNCIVVVANACSAVEGDGDLDKELGFVTLPMKAQDKRSSKVIPYFRRDCKRICNEQCVGKRIEIDFCSIRRDEEGISYQVSETSF